MVEDTRARLVARRNVQAARLRGHLALARAARVYAAPLATDPAAAYRVARKRRRELAQAAFWRAQVLATAAALREADRRGA